VGADALLAQRRREAPDGHVELPGRDTATRPVLVPEQDGRTVIGPAQQVLGKIQARIRKEPRARHLVRVVDGAIPHLAAYAAESPDVGPELGAVFD